MRWLKRDEGISMVLVGVLLAVLLALAGMAVDLGVVYAERRELRNGADAAALAVAEDCGRKTKPCDEATAQATAEQYADANAGDAASAVQSIDLTFNSATTGRVQVVTSAWDPAAGASGVRVPLLSLLGFNRVDVGGRAAAIFDHPASAIAPLPAIIDVCEFFNAGGYGSGQTTLLYFLSPSSTDPAPAECPSNPAYMDFPGGFAWLEPNTGGSCAVALFSGTFAVSSTGEAVPVPECLSSAALRAAIYEQDILLPLFDEVRAQDKEYRVFGFSAFHVTAYKLTSGATYAWPAGFKCPESPASTCLKGYFTSTTVYTGDPGGEDLGVVLVKLVE